MRTIIGLAAATMALAALSGAAIADDREVIMASCAENLGLSTAGCECVADKAMNEFSEAEFAFFMAVIKNDRAAQTEAATDMSREQKVHIGSRMNDLPGECAG